MKVGISGCGTWPVLTCSYRIASYSPAVTVGMCGGCGSVGVFVPVLAATRPWRLSMIFLSSSA